jgi:hypothetical protein
MAALIACIIVVPAQSQRSVRNVVPIVVQIKIEIAGQCSDGDKILAVINGDERNQHLLRPDERVSGTSVWIFPWPDKRPSAFPNAKLTASLRLKHARTYCRIAEQQPNRTGDLIASFSFPCDGQPAQEVNILTESTDQAVAVPLSYVRMIGKNPDSQDNGDCECLETGGSSGALAVPAVRFPAEAFWLQIGRTLPRRKAPGLFVNDPAVIEHAENGGHRVLDREDVVCALAAQRVAGRQGPNPDLSSNAMEVDSKTLEDIRLKSIDLKVTK